MGCKTSALLGLATAALVSLPGVAKADWAYILVKTSDIGGAGADGDVFATLVSRSGVTVKSELDTMDYDDFEQGDGHWYRVEIPSSFDLMTRFRIEYWNDSVFDDPWQFDYIYVVIPPTASTPSLAPGTPTATAWFNGQSVGDGTLYRCVIPPEDTDRQFHNGYARDFNFPWS